MPFNSIAYCLLSGILLALSTPLSGIWQLSFVAFIPFLFAIENQFQLGNTSLYRAYFLGFVFSYLYALSNLYWIMNMSWLAMFAATTLYAIIYGLFAPGIILGLRAGLHGLIFSLWTIFLWLSLEIFMSDVFFRFPSLAIGYLAWPCHNLIQIADVTGVFGVSFFIITVNILIFRLIKDGFKKNISFLVITIVIACFPAGYGFPKLSSTSNTSSPAISTNIIYTSFLGTDKKNKTDRKKIFETLKQKTTKSIHVSEYHPELIIWPETSVPVFLRSVREKEFIKELMDTARSNNVPILIGALSFKRAKNNSIQKYNAAFLIPKTSFISQEYHKNILAPFVETNPFEKVLPKQIQWFGKSKFDAGKKPGLIYLYGDFRFGVIICYEEVFPNFVRKCANKGSGFLVNITNDRHAFGDIKAAYKIPIPHLVFRAVENHKFLIRSANWGYSMVISPHGEIMKSSPIGSTGYLSAKIVPNHDETFFSKYGFLLAKILFSITVIWAILLNKKAWKSNKS